MKNVIILIVLIVGSCTLVWQYNNLPKRVEAKETLESSYPAELIRTIEVNIATFYCKKVTHQELWGRIPDDMKAATGTFHIPQVPGEFTELPHNNSLCRSCIKYMPKTYIKKKIKDSMLRATVETKKITALKSDYVFTCDKTFWYGTCMKPLTDGSVIIQYKWEKDDK